MPLTEAPGPALQPRRHAPVSPDGIARSPDVHRPSVLVLLAACNGEKWIHHQIESILAQQDVQLRLVIRDDGSVDATREEIARFECDERLTLTLCPEPTGSAAQNFLCLIRENPADDFEFVAFSDQDDIWHPTKLARACSLLSGSGAVGYSGATAATWPDGRMIVLSQAHTVTAADFLFEGAGQGCTFVVRADFYSKVRTFITAHPAVTAELHYHDWLVYALARCWDCAWTFDSLALTTYRQHSSNDTGARATFAGVRKRLRLIRRGWYRDQLLAIATVCAAAAPANPAVATWLSLLLARRGLMRSLRIVFFVFRNGRRRRRDNAAVIVAAFAGWL